MTTFSPRSFSRSPSSLGRTALRAAALGLGLALAACGGGGGGGGNASAQTGDNSPTPLRAEFLELQGAWRVVASDLQYDDPNAPQVALGVENSGLELAFVADDAVEGLAGSYVAVYRVNLAGADTTSPSFGPGMATVAVAQRPDGAVNFQLGGVYYVSSRGITVALQSQDAPWGPSAGTYAFQVYSGQQLVSVQVNEPDVDDDGDGVIDEEGEFALHDEIAPGAVMVNSGTMTLAFVR